VVHPDVYRFFEEGALHFGKSHQALGYFSEFTQHLRFWVFASELLWEPHHRVLDVGCGQGDLVQFCQDHDYACEYQGIDVSPSMIDVAMRSYPQASFLVADFMDISYTPDADFIVGSGLANLDVDGVMAYSLGIIEKGFRLSRRGCAFNFLSSHTPRADRKAKMHYYDPVELMRFCFTLTSNVVLKHHYLQNDFTVVLFKSGVD